MTNDELEKALNILLARVHLWEASVRKLTVAEYNLLMDLGEWYEEKGKLIAESRRLTAMQIVLD